MNSTVETARAVVLGAGGVVGTAWMAGLATGLREAGVDLAAADLILGTSAGSIIGTMLATGQDLAGLAVPPPSAPATAPAPQPDPVLIKAVFEVLADRGLDPEAARRRVGRLALDAPTGTEQARLAAMGVLISAREWPQRRLLITAVDVQTGELKVFGRADGAPLLSAVTASTAMPGVYPPITVNGRRYMDGGIRSGTNADLAAGAGLLVVIEPLAHLFPREVLAYEISVADPETVVTISPDAQAIDAFGPDLFDRAAWQPAYQAGAQQAAQAAERILSRSTYGFVL